MSRVEQEKFGSAMAANPMKFWVPNGGQELAIKTLAHSLDKVKLPIVSWFSGNGVGKCLKLSTPILMADNSWKPLSDIVAGDRVIGHDYQTGVATPCNVLSTSRAGMKGIHRFTFTDGGYVEASKEHEFPIKLKSGRGNKVKKIRVRDLLKRDVKYIGGKIKFQQPKELNFENQPALPIDPYILGILIGDGGLTKGARFTTIDKCIADRVSGRLAEGYSLSLERYKGKCDTFRITKKSTSNSYIDALKKLNLYGKTSKNKFIPEIYLSASVEDRKQLLAGLIDSDGTFKEYTSISEQLADDFVRLSKSLGGRAIKHTREQQTNFSKGRLCRSHRVYWKFDYELPLSMSHKQQVSKNQVEYSNRVVKYIDYMGEFECGDIHVDHPSHTFISHDYISTGNTDWAVEVVGNLSQGVQSGWFDHPFFHNWKYEKTIWYCSTPNNLRTNIIPALRKRFKDTVFDEDYDDFKDGKQWVSRVSINGWEIQCKTYQQDDDDYESSTVGMIILDEPCPESKWRAVKSRRRMGCVIVLPMTPLDTPPYVVDEIEVNVEQDFANEKAGVKVKPSGYFKIETDAYVSCKERGVRGHRDPEIIDEEIRGYQKNPEEVEARVYGRSTYFSGRIFPQISKDRNVRDQIPVHENAVLVMSVDPHDSRPCAVGWWAFNPDGRKICLAESPLRQDIPFWEQKRGLIKLKDEVIEWKKIQGGILKELNKSGGKWNEFSVYQVMDRHYGWNERVTKSGLNTTYAEILNETGNLPDVQFQLNFTESYTSNKKDGEIKVGHLLIAEADEIMGDGHPGLIFRSRCVHHIAAATHYMREKVTGKSADMKAVSSGRIVEKFKDFVDTMRYALGTRLQAHIPDPKQTPLDDWVDAIDSGEEIYDERELEDVFG